MNVMVITVAVVLVMGLCIHNYHNLPLTHIAAADKKAEITLSDALSIVRNELKRENERDARYHLVVDEALTQEYPFGWVIEIAPPKYLETRNIDDKPPGVGSYIVDRDGTIDYISTASNPPRYIESHLEEWLSTHRH